MRQASDRDMVLTMLIVTRWSGPGFGDKHDIRMFGAKALGANAWLANLGSLLLFCLK